MQLLKALNAPLADPSLPIPSALAAVRAAVLEGVPALGEREMGELRDNNTTTLRGRLWKVLLGACDVPCEEYLGLVSHGPSLMHRKIADDTFRTFASDHNFTSRVPQEKLIRVLNAVVHQAQASAETAHIGYVQGMNAVCGVLLIVLNELDAFSVLWTLATRHCPLYFDTCLDGVHSACRLVDKGLEDTDGELAAHLSTCSLSAEIYALPWVLSLGSSTPPLSEAIKWFDYMFAEGVHMCVPFSLARLQLLRSELLSSERPMQVLQRVQTIDAERIIEKAKCVWRSLPPQMREEISAHPWARDAPAPQHPHTPDCGSPDPV
eukprot:CAMPEP_0206251870 /NCGR_PEP_ID=MMETSP0047_2-20121206/22259_1 /ASSEMBLY_ACC=CAM_ASM_000192 /TAXON_ID=195065 /ORGANISM="Chroomonas mesostigmatica_cf, Strain CCMP1168" /LENGTH=320 /DNA_ID=CAMNT_0053677861 /DNA_START=97 /DNA_END=1059 /DNA_ORIENTATION=-